MNLSSLNSLASGQTFKNYKDICSFLNEQEKSRGNSRNSQFKEWERYFSWHKEGNRFVIDTIYSEVKEKVDNRKGNSGKSNGSRNNYKGIYAEYIDILLLQYLQKKELKLIDTCKIYTTNNLIAEATGIVNTNYRTALANQGKFYNIVKKDFNINTNIYCMTDVFYITKSKIREIVKSSLDRLQKAEKLDYETCYLLYIPYTVRAPTKNELRIINNAEESIMQEMGVKTKKQIDNSYKLFKEFNAKVLKMVHMNGLEYVESIFKGYSIVLCKDFEIKSNAEIKELRNKLNAIVVKSLKEKPKKIKEKTMQDEGIQRWIGLRDSFWKPWVYDRMSKKYIEYCYNFIDILCNLEAKNITEKIKNCKDGKMDIGLICEQREVEKDKIILDFINDLGE